MNGIQAVAPSDDGYTRTPNKVRVYDDGDPDYPWTVDGIDTRTARPDENRPGRMMYDYTEAVWSYATWAEAMAAVPEFIKEHLS